MSIQSKYKGKCRDCKVEFPQGATISTNKNNNWCVNGEKCTAFYSTTENTSASVISPNLDTKKINAEIDIIIQLEKIVTTKLGLDTNPAKIGMYMKFLYDSTGDIQ